MKVSLILTVMLASISLALPGCNQVEEEHIEAHKIVATNPQMKAVTLSVPYVCQIHSQRHIEVCALEMGYLEEIKIKEGQRVVKDQELFKVRPILYQKKAAAEAAEAKVAQLEYSYSQKLFEDKVVSKNEVLLKGAGFDKAQARADLAAAELDFATVKAAFDGIVDRLHLQQGSLVKEGEVLSTMSDNSVMWVYFNVPEARYLEYMADVSQNKGELQIELVLANGQKFDQIGVIGAIEADFNNTNGNIPFRADFPNPERDAAGNRLLRHGQTGTILISRVQNNAILIPQRATYEVLQKRYVYVVDKDNIARQREIKIQNELEDLFVLKEGNLGVEDKIVLEGIRQIRDGDTVECEERQAKEVVANLKFHAE